MDSCFIYAEINSGGFQHSEIKPAAMSSLGVIRVGFFNSEALAGYANRPAVV